MKIISGGQTGADLGGLEGARDVGIETGGTAPSNYYTESGSNYTLRDVYGLRAEGTFQTRTRQNILDSDLTLIFASDLSSPGTKLTIHCCNRYNKRYLLNPTAQDIKKYLSNFLPNIINVAGNRESKAPGVQAKVRKIIAEAFKSEQDLLEDQWVE